MGILDKNSNDAMYVTGASSKKKKSAGIIAGVFALAVIGGSAMLYNFVPVVKNSVRMALMKPDEYMTTIQTENLRSTSAKLAQKYQKNYDYYTADSLGAEMSLSVDLAEPYEIEEGMSISNADAGISVALNDETISENITLSVNDTEVAGIDIIVDLVENTMLMNIPELSESFINIEDEYTFVNMNYFDMSMYEKITPEFIENFSNKYGDIIIDKLSNCDVELEKNASGTVAGVSYKYNVISAEVSETQCYEAVLEIMKAMKEDSEIKEIYTSYFDSYMEIYEDMDIEAGEMDFDTVMDEKIADIEEEIESAETEPEAVVSIYVDPEGTIRGYNFKVEDNEDDYSAEAGFNVAKDGNQYGIEVSYMDEIMLEITASENNGEYTGVCNIVSEDDEMNFGIDFENLKIENEELGLVSGTLSMDLSEIEESLSEFKLELEVEEDKQKISCNIPDIADVSLDYAIVENPEIPSVPTDSISIEDISDEDGEAWLKGIFEKLGWDYEELYSEPDYEYDYDEYLDDEYYEDYEEYDDYQEENYDFLEYYDDLSSADIKINGNSVLMPASMPEIYNMIANDSNSYSYDMTDTVSFSCTGDDSIMVIFSSLADSINESTPVEYLYYTPIDGTTADISVNGITIGSSPSEVAKAFGLDEDEVKNLSLAYDRFSIYIDDENNYDYYIGFEFIDNAVSSIELDFSSEF